MSEDTCQSFLNRGTRKGIPTIQCERRWRWAVVMWPGMKNEIESRHCQQHGKQVVRECQAAKVPYQLTDRGVS